MGASCVGAMPRDDAFEAGHFKVFTGPNTMTFSHGFPARVIRVMMLLTCCSTHAFAADPFIQGYPGQRSHVAGEGATFHLSSNLEKVNLEIARVGAEREVVWRGKEIHVAEQPVPAHASSHGCDWPISVTVEIPGDWRSGCYEATASSGGTQGNPMFFVVRSSNPGRDAKILLQLSTNTYNAYNAWGGYSLYTHWGSAHWNMKHDPGDVLGRRVSFQRPFGGVDRNWELPFIQWAERNGYKIDYAVNLSLIHI